MVKPPEDSGTSVKCVLDQGGDPVGLCVQKFVLLAWHDAAFAPGTGVVESWDSTTFAPDEDGEGKVLHDRRDDAAYGAALARYYPSAKIYGDDEINATVVQDLKALVPLIESQFAALPDEYDGELYWNLRAMASGLRVLNELPSAGKIDAVAEAYGRAIFASHYHTLPDAPSDAGAPDAPDAPDGFDGSDATDGSDAAEALDGDATPAEVVTGNAIIGTAAAGQVEYDAASAASAALALVDLAWRNPQDANAAEWQRAAVRVWMHLWAQAREPSTGMLYRTMITTSSGVDTVSGQSPQDVLWIDVQATVALSLLRALELTIAHPAELSIVAGWPMLATAETVIASANGSPGLWDAQRGGYYEGLVASSQQVLTDKPTLGNGRMLSAVHRAAVEGSSPYVGQLTTLRTLMMQRFPLSSSLLSSLDGQAGYFRSVPRDYKMEGLDAGAPRYWSYFSKANGWGCEALADGWYGIEH